MLFATMISINAVSVSATTSREAIPQTPRFNQWEKRVLDKANSEVPKGDFKVQNSNKQMSRARVGSWSWRDGVICITDSYASSPLFNNGHAGIIAATPYYYATIEANPGSGVQPQYGSWESKYSNKMVYQYGVTRTSVRQDQMAAEWAAKQIGKPYNNNFWNIGRRDAFYCSHLVWATYKDVTGVDIGTWAWGTPIHPFELMDSGETTLIFRNK